MNETVLKKVAEKVKDLAVDVARKTVGRSLPCWVHEVEIGDEVWHWIHQNRKGD